MSKTNSHLFLAFLIALLAVFLFVGSVSADDGSSTPAPAATSAAAVTDEATQVPQVTATEEATQVTTPAATATATPDDSAAGVTEPPATEESPTAEVSAQQTATPEPTVLTETETAAEATATATLAPTAASDSDAATAEATAAASTSTGGDPYFMVGVHKYAFVSDGEDCPDQGSANTTCIVTSTSDPTKSTNVIKTAIQYIADNGLIPTDKKIYILKGTYKESITIDGSNLSLSKLQGIIGVDGSSLTTISGSVTITNTATGFTLSGFTITGGVDFESNKGALTLSDLIVSATGNTGITVSGQQGTTTLSNVKVSNSANAGVQISNQNGAVTLSNLSVSTSSGEGIEVSSRSGAITLTNVESNDNKGNGAKIDNSISTSAAPISITNSEFNDNNASSGDAEGYGLYISPAGAVTLDGVSANGNIGDGLDIISPKAAVMISNGAFSNNTSSESNYGVGLCIFSSSAPTVTLVNIQANGNSYDGLQLLAYGSFNLSQVTSGSNSYGAVIGGLLNTVLYTPASVTIGNSDFSKNTNSGLLVQSKGNIQLSYVSAQGNKNGRGASLDNCLVGTDGKCVGNGSVTLLNPNLVSALFSGNTDTGLYILSSGAVAVNGVSAIANSGSASDGLYIKNNYSGKSGSVTISTYPGGFTLDNSQFSNNGGSGIEIYSNGAVSILGQIRSSILVKGNTAYGIVIGDGSNPVLGAVTLAELDVESSSKTGVRVYASGNISLTDVTSLNNGNSSNPSAYGIYLNNCAGKGNVIVSGGSADGSQSYGYLIYSSGTVTLSGVESSTNGIDGLMIDNTAGAGKAVAVSGSTFNSNKFSGLEIETSGPVTLTGITASMNTLAGTYIVNNLAGTAAAVTLSGGTFSNNNGGPGLSITTLGAVSLKNITAIYNFGDGVNIDNCGYNSTSKTCAGKAAVSVVGDSNTFNQNNGNGLKITTIGLVTLNNISANNNYSAGAGIGIDIVAPVLAAPITSGGVILTSSSQSNYVSGNPGYGIYIYTYGPVSLQGIGQNYYYGGGGIYIKNVDAATAQPVTLISSSQDYATGNGIEIYTKGKVTLSGVDSSNNQGYGVYIDNSQGTADISISSVLTLLSANSYNQMGSYYDNNKDGIKLITNGNVAITGIYADSNQGDGIDLTGKGNVVLSGLNTSSNQQNGIVLVDSVEGKTITLTNVTAGSNTLVGVSITALGPVTWTTGDIYNNGGDGVDVTINSISAARAVTLTSVNIAGSGATGLVVSTNGAITLKQVKSQSNALEGALLDNSAAGSAQPVTITDSVFDYNQSGLTINSLGTVSLLGLEAQNNFNKGETISGLIGHTINSYLGNDVYTFNYSAQWYSGQQQASATWKFDSSASQTVTIRLTSGFSGTLAFYDASNAQVYEYSFNAGVSGNSVDLGIGTYTMVITADYFNPGTYSLSLNDDSQVNVLDEMTPCVKINNDGSGTGNVILNKGSTITGVNIDNNGGDGLVIGSNGTVTVNAADISDNAGNGLVITAKGAVVVTSANTNSNSAGDGLNILASGGPVTLTSINANSNSGWGIEVSSSGEGMAVNFKTIAANDNLTGTIQLTAKGPVVWTNVSADGNDAGSGAVITVTSTAPQPVTISGSSINNTASNNGLKVTTMGNILLTDVSASNNTGGDGIYLDNRSGVSSTITINTTNVSLNKNATDGLAAYSNGAIKFTGKAVSATNNGGNGILLDNSTGTGSVTVTGTYNATTLTYTYNFIGNGTDGLFILSNGAVVFSNIQASGNQYNGIGVSGTIYPTSVSASNLEANSNGTSTASDGIFIYAAGPISLTNVLSSGNSANGVTLINSGIPSAAVSVKKGNFSSNSSDGLRIISTGNVTLDSILANYNAAALDVQTTGSVTLLGSLYTNQFNNSTSTAVVVTSTAGTITLSKFTAMNNGSDALSVDSSGKLAVIDATLTNNQGSGIVATAANGAAFTNVISSGNGSTTSNGSGILLTVTGNSVSFTKSSFNNNVGFGISISGSPVVTITSTSYVGNDTDKSGDRNYSGS